LGSLRVFFFDTSGLYIRKQPSAPVSEKVLVDSSGVGLTKIPLVSARFSNIESFFAKPVIGCVPSTYKESSGYF
jgi:hypothetical protein